MKWSHKSVQSYWSHRIDSVKATDLSDWSNGSRIETDPWTMTLIQPELRKNIEILSWSACKPSKQKDHERIFIITADRDKKITQGSMRLFTKLNECRVVISRKGHQGIKLLQQIEQRGRLKNSKSGRIWLILAESQNWSLISISVEYRYCALNDVRSSLFSFTSTTCFQTTGPGRHAFTTIRVNVPWIPAWFYSVQRNQISVCRNDLLLLAQALSPRFFWFCTEGSKIQTEHNSYEWKQDLIPHQ